MGIEIIIGLVAFILTTITAAVFDIKYEINCPPLYWFLGSLGAIVAMAPFVIN
jgi:hypothetical protein